MAILLSDVASWDQSKGSLTSGTIGGNVQQHVIGFPDLAADLAIGDVLVLCTMKASQVLTKIKVRRRILSDDKTGTALSLSVTHLGIDPLTKEYKVINYAAGEPSNFSIAATYDADKKVAPIAVAAAALEADLYPQVVFRGNDPAVAAHTIPELFYAPRSDDSIGLLAEVALSNLVNCGTGVPTGNPALDYPNYRGNAYFGIGVLTAAALAVAQAKELEFIISYKDTNLSETSYGSKYIPTQYMG
jgi:hypothetical protein